MIKCDNIIIYLQLNIICLILFLQARDRLRSVVAPPVKINSSNGELMEYIEYIGLFTGSYELPTSKEFEVVFVLI